MPVKPLAPRYTIEDLGETLVVSIPSLKMWPFILLFSFWSFWWIGLEVVFLIALFTAKESSRINALIIIAIWTVAGAFLLYNLFWQVFGKEEIQVTALSIMISHVVLGYKRSKEFLAENIRDLGLARVSMRDLLYRRWPFPLLGSDAGSISFDYGARTYRFAASLDDAEAKQLIAAVQQKYPQYKQQIQEP